MSDQTEGAEALSDDERAILLRPCACGHTINDHGSLAGCWTCGDMDTGDDCEVHFEDLLIERVGTIVAARAAVVAARGAEGGGEDE
jgi:hypothetical protein